MPAPKYKADIESRQMNLEQHWEKMDKDIKSKDESHSKRLKDVSPKINDYSAGLFLSILRKTQNKKILSFSKKNSANFPQKLTQINLETQCTGTVY